MGTGGAPFGACAGPGWNPHRQVGWAGVGSGSLGALGQAGLRVRTVSLEAGGVSAGAGLQQPQRDAAQLWGRDIEVCEVGREGTLSRLAPVQPQNFLPSWASSSPRPLLVDPQVPQRSSVVSSVGLSQSPQGHTQ